jgi:hypothetical protein
MNSTAVRLGGLCGVAAAATAIPAYVVGSPELPNTPEKLAGYYEKAESFIAANGTIPLIHLFLGIVFIAVLVAVLRAAMGPEPAVYMAVIGGAVFIALTAAGLATEVAIPAVIARFGDVIEVGVVRPFLALSVWLYHYSQIGSAIVMFATSYAIWRTQVLPKWTAAAGVLGILALAHTWLGLPAAYGTVAWMALMGLVLLAFPPSVQAKEAAVKRPAKTSEPKKAAASPVAMLATEDGADVVPPAADAAAVPTVEDPVVIAAAETVDAKLPTESTDADDEGSNK